MFTVQEIQHTNPLFKSFHIHNSQVSCKIYPNLGASLQQFSIRQVEIIQGVHSLESDLPYYRRYYPSSFLFPFPGRIANGKYEFEGTAYQLDKNEGGRDNAIHGFLAEASFTLAHQELNNDFAKLNFQHSYQGGEKGFPFPADIHIVYEISETIVNITVKITNTGESSFPFGLGWHPYFLAQNLGESTLNFESNQQLTVDKNQIPNGTEPTHFKPTIGNQVLDDTYLLNNSEIHFSTQAYQMHMNTFSTKKNFLQLYIPPDRKSIAIEPMTCAPDVFNYNNGLLELAPNETYDWSISMDFKILN